MEIFSKTQFLLRLTGVRRQPNGTFSNSFSLFIRCFLFVDVVGQIVFLLSTNLPVYLLIFTFGMWSEMTSAFVCSFLFNSRRDEIDQLVEQLQEIILSSQFIEFWLRKRSHVNWVSFQDE